MSLYLIDRRNGDLGLDLAQKDENSKIVLIQDGVYLNVNPVKGIKEVFYVKNDLVKRGIEKLPEGAVVVDYDELIGMMESENVINFM
jgi:sulfur relay protein TusB/DsrH